MGAKRESQLRRQLRKIESQLQIQTTVNEERMDYLTELQSQLNALRWEGATNKILAERYHDLMVFIACHVATEPELLEKWQGFLRYPPDAIQTEDPKPYLFPS